MIGERDVLRIEDSVWEGDIVRGTGLRGGEGRKVGGDNMGGLKPNGMRHSYMLLSRLRGSDGSDAVGGQGIYSPQGPEVGARIPPDSVEREPRGAVFGPK